MYATNLADIVRKHGFDVVEVGGWQTRGHGGLSGIKGLVLHHTAGPKSGNYPSLKTVAYGRPGLDGPLAQIGLARDGSIYIIAAGKCWHAGTGIWHGERSGNSYFLGIEAESTGHGDWTPSQIAAYPRLVAVLVYELGLSMDWVIAHLEWATPKGRKIDVVWPGGPDALRQAALAELGRIVKKPSRSSERTHPAKPTVTAKAKARVTRKLVVDGKFGPNTVKALQRVLHVAVDGDYGPQTKKALQHHLHVAADGVVGPITVRALQRRVGASADGVWGPKTTAALQRALNAGKF